MNELNTNPTPDPDRLSGIFAALADPTRRAILERLVQGPAVVGELAAPFNISAPAISRHLKVLQAAGLITRETNAQWRRCRLDPAPLKEAADWIEHYRRFWENQFEALAQYLAQKQNKERENADDT